MPNEVLSVIIKHLCSASRERLVLACKAMGSTWSKLHLVISALGVDLRGFARYPSRQIRELHVSMDMRTKPPHVRDPTHESMTAIFKEQRLINLRTIQITNALVPNVVSSEMLRLACSCSIYVIHWFCTTFHRNSKSAEFR